MGTGFAVSSASLVSFLLFHSFTDCLGDGNQHVDIVQPEIFVGGALGVMVVSSFRTLATQAVGSTAEHMVAHLRHLYQDMAGNEGQERTPDFASYVQILTRFALRSMLRPALLACLMPLGVAIFFRGLGYLPGDLNLGDKALASYCVCLAMAAMLES